MAKGTFCNVCGGRTHGRYYIYQRLRSKRTQQKKQLNQGLIVCTTCQQDAPHCQACHVPINRTISPEGFCPICTEKLPRCSACGQRIQGRYVVNQSNGAIYCEPCFDRQPRCASCHGAVGVKGHQLHDGRYICAQCGETAIYDHQKANVLYQRVRLVMREQLGIHVQKQPTLVLVDRHQMQDVLKQALRRKVTEPHLIAGLFAQKGKKRGIYIENGIPQILMLQIIAHEYAHAWQSENCPRQQDPLIREGFAEWAAYRVLTLLGAVKKANVMRQRTDLYGQGLQLMLAVEQQGGIDAVIKKAKQRTATSEINNSARGA